MLTSAVPGVTRGRLEGNGSACDEWLNVPKAGLHGQFVLLGRHSRLHHEYIGGLAPIQEYF